MNGNSPEYPMLVLGVALDYLLGFTTQPSNIAMYCLRQGQSDYLVIVRGNDLYRAVVVGMKVHAFELGQNFHPGHYPPDVQLYKLRACTLSGDIAAKVAFAGIVGNALMIVVEMADGYDAYLFDDKMNAFNIMDVLPNEEPVN